MNNAIDTLRSKRNRVRWVRIDPNGPGLHSPQREHDVGWDLEASETIRIPASSAIDVPTNVRLELPDGIWAEIRARSSIVRRGLQVDAGTIDPGYRGPLFALVRNMSMPFRSHHNMILPTIDGDVTIEAGERVAQVVFHHVTPVWGMEVDAIDDNSDRGTAGFGSTGRFSR